MELNREFINKMADHPILPKVEEIRLSKLKDQGDKKARKKLICHNIRLVLSQLPKFTGRGLPEDDLIQEGIIGLIRGVDRYQWERGYKLSTYAVFWIRQSLGRALADQGRIIRLPVHMFDQATKILAFQDFYRLQGIDDIGQVAAEVGISTEQAEKILGYNLLSLPASLDRDHTDNGKGDGTTYAQFIPDEGPSVVEAVEANDANRVIGEVLDILSPREARILEMRFGLNGYGGQTFTLDQIGQKFGITRERVRQIEKECLQKIRGSQNIMKQMEDIC
jgi:RNA polymerase primary sigma factor